MPGGSGEITFLAAGLVAFILWTPALAAAAFSARRIHESSQRRGDAIWLSRGVAGVVASLILLVWLPVYVSAIIVLLHLADAFLW